jgi:hypothetical protein
MEVTEMRTKAVIGIAAAAVFAGGYLIGYWPERRVRIAAEAETVALQSRLVTAEARLRVGALLGQALTLKEVAMRHDYGQALQLSSSFFNAVRDEPARSVSGELSNLLNEVLTMRDAVTAALAKADPSVVETLHRIELSLRRALAYPLPPESLSSPS